MKIIKFLFKPMKYLVLLLAVGALIYYRTIIFHTNVNQYIDVALSYAEQQFDIEIPKHIDETETANTVAQSIEPPVTSNTDNQVVDLQSQQAPVDVVASDLSTSDDINIETPVADNIETPVADDSSQADDKLNLIEGLSETVNIINKKVDMLFDVSTADPVVEHSQASNKASDSLTEVPVNDNSQNNTQENNITASSDFDSSDTKKMLIMARQSFWSGNTQVSEKFYLDLTRLEDGDPDIYGELGNVYYAQGKWKQAGQAYYEAAVRLLALQQANQVSYLLRVIQGLDRESAEKLRHKISG